MDLNNQIKLQPPPFKDNNGNLVNPPEIVLDKLEITYVINPQGKYINAQIAKVPTMLTIATGPLFDSLSNLNISTLENLVNLKLGDNPQAVLQSLFPRTLESDPYGPGTILSEMLSYIGIKSTANCSCKRHAITMNTNGNDWCEANMDTIMGWLKEESSRRNLPFVDSVARLIVNRAIKTSRRMLIKNNG